MLRGKERKKRKKEQIYKVKQRQIKKILKENKGINVEKTIGLKN